MKNSFVLYTDYKQHIDLLSVEEKGQLLDALFKYANGEEFELDGMALLAFSFIKAQMDRDNEKYEEICRKRREAGAKGGAPKGNKNATKQPKTTKNNQKQTKQPVTDTDTEYDTDTENDTDTETDTEINKKKKPAAAKKTFGENQKVKLTDREYELLVAEYGVTLTNRAIEFLDAYITDKGYKSKSNYLAIRRWVIDAVQEKRQRAAPDQKQGIEDFFAEIRGGTA